MKYLIFIAFATILVSCGNNTDKNQFETASDNTSSNKAFVDFLDREIPIPNNYRQIQLEDLKQKLSSTKKDSKIAEAFESGIARLEQMPFDYMIFADQDNYENCFWIHPSKFMELDEEKASQYVSLLDRQVSQTWTQMGFTFERLENEFIQTENAQLIKVKFRQAYQGQEKYQTQYVITSDQKTFGLVVSNYDNIDFEDLAKRM